MFSTAGGIDESLLLTWRKTSKRLTKAIKKKIGWRKQRDSTMKTIRMMVLLGASMLIISSAAQAADPVIDVPEMHDWSGIYAGVHAGYGWGDRDWDDDDGDFDDEAFRYDLRGAVAGGQIGFNFQVDNFVLGIEADGAWSDMRDNVSEPLFGPFHIDAEAEMEWLATVRGRAGFAW